MYACSLISKIMKGTLWGVLFFCSLNVWAQSADDLQWQRLLIYRKTFLGYESEADDENFFLHKEGKTHPQKELNALIEALRLDDPDQTKNAFCRFPARVRWLKKFQNVPDSKVNCENYLKFRDRLGAKSLSIIFSSYYLNNPASSFGHTFIRLGKQSFNEPQDPSRTELLDTGINYGAMTEGAGPVVFAIGGLTGWFQGNYNAVPYYYKVREYNDFETRDLWSYELNMTQEEIDLIVDHIWELGHTKFDYFFLTENCSYHVLSILEAARPALNLHAHLPGFYTIPSETLKALEREGLIRKVTFRPAPSTQFYHQLNLLTSNEKEEVRDLVFKKKEVSTQDPLRKSLVYDTALSLVDYQYAKEILKGDEEAQKIKRPLLIGRSKIPLRSEDIDYSYKLNRAPHLGHGQKRLGISYLASGDKSLMDIEWRFAFHDVLDSDIGYPPKTRLEVMKAILRTDGNHYQLRDFSLIDVLMLGKWDNFNRSGSWKIKMGSTQTRYEGKDLSTAGFSGGYGFSTEWGPVTPFLLAHVENSYVSERLHKYKFAYGGDLGIITDLSDNWKLLNSFEGRVHPWNESRWVNEIRYSNQLLGIGGYYNNWTTEGKTEIGLRFFKYL